jgi:hypothetical protein
MKGRRIKNILELLLRSRCPQSIERLEPVRNLAKAKEFAFNPSGASHVAALDSFGSARCTSLFGLEIVQGLVYYA